MNINKTFIANWKMYLTPNQEDKLARELNILTENIKPKDEIIICPSMVNLQNINNIFMNNQYIKVGSQYVSNQLSGAYTGQTSILALKELHIKNCIVGHIEERKYFHEDNRIISEKFNLLIDNGISPILWIGENKEDRSKNRTFDKLDNQLAGAFSKLDKINDKLANKITVYIAYEPVWLIGMGRSATSDEISNIFEWLKIKTEKYKSSNIEIKLIYGGGVTPDNIGTLKLISNIDGFLIGKASTDLKKLIAIITTQARIK